jgi:hypothetical protein
LTIYSIYDILIANRKRFSVTDGIIVEYHEEAESLMIADRLGTLNSLWVKCALMSFYDLEVHYEKSWYRDGK